MDIGEVFLGGVIGFFFGLGTTWFGAKLRERSEEKTRSTLRARPIIRDEELVIKDGFTAQIEVINIGNTTARSCLLRASLFDREKVLLSREFWKDVSPDNLLDPEYNAKIPWFIYNSKEKALTFLMAEGGPIKYHLNELLFPITGTVAVYAIDSDCDYYEYQIQLRQDVPYIQKGTNRINPVARTVEDTDEISYQWKNVK